MILRLILPACALLALTACASEKAQTSAENPAAWQSVRVDTPGVYGATCVLQAPAGSYVLTSPARIDVPREAGTLAVSCSKGEHFRGAQTVASRKVVENGDDTYTYPASVSVPMTLYDPSLQPKYRVLRDGRG